MASAPGGSPGNNVISKSKEAPKSIAHGGETIMSTNDCLDKREPELSETARQVGLVKDQKGVKSRTTKWR